MTVISSFSRFSRATAGSCLLALGLLIGASAPARSQTATSNPAFPLGVHVSNPHGNDANEERAFENAYDEFVATMGNVRPTHFNAFVDFRLEPTTGKNGWVDNAGWTAWSCNKTGPRYYGASTGIVPVVGVPMASNSGGWGNVDNFYQDIIAGKYDDVYAGIVQAWAGQGYNKIEFRNGYEFNSTFMAWSLPVKSPSGRQHFVQAFQRIANIQHNEGRRLNIQVLVNWNPNGTSYTDEYDTRDLYPGDSYVDIISVDQYSPLWPQDYTDWHNNVQQQLSPAAFAADPVNRRHFWTWPGDKYWKSAHTGQEVTLGDWSWSVRMTTDFAKLHGKPIAVDETGAGPSADPNALGPSDEPEFPHWLSDELKRAQSLGVAVDHVNIWASWEGDGDWNFLPSNTAHPKPLEAAAWARYFGAGSGTTGANQLANGTYKLVARHSGLALDVSANSAADGADVVQWPWNGGSNQQWVVERQSDGYYTLTHQGTNQRLDVNGNNNGNGTRVQQYRANNSDAQRWTIAPADNGYYKLLHKDTNQCLDVDGGPQATAQGTQVHLWQYVGGTGYNNYNQQWQFVRLDNTTNRAASPAAAGPVPAAVEEPLSAYPNPSTGPATLRLQAAQIQAVPVYVHDAWGKLVMLLTVPASAGRTDFPLPSNLPAGTYFLRATLDGQKQNFTLKVN